MAADDNGALAMGTLGTKALRLGRAVGAGCVLGAFALSTTAMLVTRGTMANWSRIGSDASTRDRLTFGVRTVGNDGRSGLDGNAALSVASDDMRCSVDVARWVRTVLSSTMVKTLPTARATAAGRTHHRVDERPRGDVVDGRPSTVWECEEGFCSSDLAVVDVTRRLVTIASMSASVSSPAGGDQGSACSRRDA
jgi:hypothetical protein